MLKKAAELSKLKLSDFILFFCESQACFYKIFFVEMTENFMHKRFAYLINNLSLSTFIGNCDSTAFGSTHSHQKTVY